ncbi:MAG: Fur family transcriptional regulator [Desulfobacca sp.]|uniref:Fur family transcriptional regulator n=1 Tax=Desulfobacca sp. TaxID=2067990 RepID=UPI00404B5436
MKRYSRQRDIILEEVLRDKTHPSAQEVFDRVRPRLPKISLGTVYRNLEQLAAHGLIRKLELPGEQRRFDGDVSEHYHIRCLVCGRVDDVYGPPLTDLPKLFPALQDYTILGHHLEFIGVCPSCRQKADPSTASA